MGGMILEVEDWGLGFRLAIGWVEQWVGDLVVFQGERGERVDRGIGYHISIVLYQYSKQGTQISILLVICGLGALRLLY